MNIDERSTPAQDYIGDNAAIKNIIIIIMRFNLQ